MEILKDYSDVLKELEYLEDQIKLTRYEFHWWSGVDVEKGQGSLLGGVGVKKFGVETGMIQIEKKRRALNNLYQRREIAERKKHNIEKHLQQFKGLEYQVAYLKYIENYTLSEIAERLGYSEIRIKQISAKLGRLYRNYTDTYLSV